VRWGIPTRRVMPEFSDTEHNPATIWMCQYCGEENYEPHTICCECGKGNEKYMARHHEAWEPNDDDDIEKATRGPDDSDEGSCFNVDSFGTDD